MPAAAASYLLLPTELLLQAVDDVSDEDLVSITAGHMPMRAVALREMAARYGQMRHPHRVLLIEDGNIYAAALIQCFREHVLSNLLRKLAVLYT